MGVSTHFEFLPNQAARSLARGREPWTIPSRKRHEKLSRCLVTCPYHFNIMRLIVVSIQVNESILLTFSNAESLVRWSKNLIPNSLHRSSNARIQDSIGCELVEVWQAYRTGARTMALTSRVSQPEIQSDIPITSSDPEALMSRAIATIRCRLCHPLASQPRGI